MASVRMKARQRTLTAVDRGVRERPASRALRRQTRQRREAAESRLPKERANVAQS